MAKTQGPTYRPSKIRRVRRFGFMSRMQNWTGRRVLKNRRQKGRAKLSASTEFGNKFEKNKKFKRRR